MAISITSHNNPVFWKTVIRSSVIVAVFIYTIIGLILTQTIEIKGPVKKTYIVTEQTEIIDVGDDNIVYVIDDGENYKVYFKDDNGYKTKILKSSMCTIIEDNAENPRVEVGKVRYKYSSPSDKFLGNMSDTYCFIYVPEGSTKRV